MNLQINDVISNVIAPDLSTFRQSQAFRDIVDAVTQEQDQRREQDRLAMEEREPSRSVVPRPWQPDGQGRG